MPAPKVQRESVEKKNITAPSRVAGSLKRKKKIALRALCPRLRYKGKAFQHFVFALRASCVLLEFTKKQRHVFWSAFRVCAQALQGMRFFLALHAMCERLRQRLCPRFLSELEIENNLKGSHATPIVFADRIHTNNLFIFLALSVAPAFQFEVRNSGR